LSPERRSGQRGGAPSFGFPENFLWTEEKNRSPPGRIVLGQITVVGSFCLLVFPENYYVKVVALPPHALGKVWNGKASRRSSTAEKKCG